MKALFFAILFLFSTPTFCQNFEQYFSNCKTKGSITIYDYQKKAWIYSDKKAAKKGTLPASTFKIINSLIALEEKVIHDEKEILKWDGNAKKFKTFPIKSWNQDHNLELAFKNSTVWFYEELAQKVGLASYKKHLDLVSYGNCKIDNGKNYDFWNFGSLKVTPKQQIQLLIKLYENKLPFAQKHMSIVKDIMIEEQQDNYTLRSKSGWSYDKFDNGWYIGYLELNDNIIFFATRIKKALDEDNRLFSKCRKTITKSILSDLYEVKL